MPALLLPGTEPVSTHDSPFDSEQASGGFALAIGDDLIAEALAAVEAREAEARARPTESDAAEEDDEGSDTIEFVFNDDDGDEDDELALHADAELADPEGLDEDGELSLDIDLFGDDGDGPAAGDEALAEVMRELAEARTALAAAEAARAEALAAAGQARVPATSPQRKAAAALLSAYEQAVSDASTPEAEGPPKDKMQATMDAIFSDEYAMPGLDDDIL